MSFGKWVGLSYVLVLFMTPTPNSPLHTNRPRRHHHLRDDRGQGADRDRLRGVGGRAGGDGRAAGGRLRRAPRPAHPCGRGALWVLYVLCVPLDGWMAWTCFSFILMDRWMGIVPDPVSPHPPFQPNTAVGREPRQVHPQAGRRRDHGQRQGRGAVPRVGLGARQRVRALRGRVPRRGEGQDGINAFFLWYLHIVSVVGRAVVRGRRRAVWIVCGGRRRCDVVAFVGT